MRLALSPQKWKLQQERARSRSLADNNNNDDGYESASVCSRSRVKCRKRGDETTSTTTSRTWIPCTGRPLDIGEYKLAVNNGNFRLLFAFRRRSHMHFYINCAPHSEFESSISDCTEATLPFVGQRWHGFGRESWKLCCSFGIGSVFPESIQKPKHTNEMKCWTLGWAIADQIEYIAAFVNAIIIYFQCETISRPRLALPTHNTRTETHIFSATHHARWRVEHSLEWDALVGSGATTVWSRPNRTTNTGDNKISAICASIHQIYSVGGFEAKDFTFRVSCFLFLIFFFLFLPQPSSDCALPHFSFITIHCLRHWNMEYTLHIDVSYRITSRHLTKRKQNSITHSHAHKNYALNKQNMRMRHAVVIIVLVQFGI